MAFYSKKELAREERVHRAIEKRLEMKDRKAVDKWLEAWAKADYKELKRWEKRFAKD